MTTTTKSFASIPRQLPTSSTCSRFGWGELWGIADRTDYDLTQHMKTSGKSMEYFDPETNEKYIPYVIEPSLGVERLLPCYRMRGI